MHKRPILVATLLILPATVPLQAQPPVNIILIGWDGAQRDHLNQSLRQGELPNLKKLSQQGTMVNIDIEGTTDTKSGWTQIQTGYYQMVTGVYSNTRYQPIPKGLTIFERLEKHFGPDDIVTVAVIGKKGHVGASGPKNCSTSASSNAHTANKSFAPARSSKRTAASMSNCPANPTTTQKTASMSGTTD